jgi:hypothetical protein
LLHCESQIVETATFDTLEEAEFFFDIRQWLWESEMFLFVRDSKLRSLWSRPDILWNQSEEQLIGNQANRSSNGDREEPKNNRVGPLSSVEVHNIEGFATDEYDHNLAANHNNINSHEEPVAADSFEYVELVIETTVAKGLCKSY